MTERDIRLKSETNRLRINCCFSLVCDTLKIPLNGNQLGLKIGSSNGLNSSKTARSGKFTKLLKLDSIPSTQTIADMEGKVQGVAALYYSPLWKTLHYLESKSQNPPFDSLDFNILQYVYMPVRSKFGQLQRRCLHKSDIDNIFKIGSLSAFCCLLILRNELNRHYCNVSNNYLDKLVFQSFSNICVTNQLRNNQWNILNTIQTWLIRNSKRGLKLFPTGPQEFARVVDKKRHFVSLFIKEFKTWITVNEEILLASLMSLSNEKLLQKELLEITNEARVATKEEKGLYWVICKLNSACPRSERIRIKFV